MTRQSESATDFFIRNAVIDESSVIASVLLQAFIEYKPLYSPGGFSATTPTSDQIRARWIEGPVWVAVQNENLLGTAAAVSKGGGLYIRSMAVLPFVRGYGIAGQLLREIENYAFISRHKYLFLSTTPFLKSAIRLYERFGFKLCDKGKDDLFGTPLFMMVKQLELGETESGD